MSSLLNVNKQPVADLNNEPARKMVTSPVMVDGKVEYRTERVPSGRFLKVVKPNGGVDRIPLHNGRANTAVDDPYKRDKETIKPLLGAVPYGQCPQTLSHEIRNGFLPPKAWGYNEPIIPEFLKGRQACTVSVSGGPINAGNPCKCIEELIAYRKKWQGARMEIRERLTQSDLQSSIKSQAAAAENLAIAAEKSAQGQSAMTDVVKDLAEMVRDMKQPQHKKRGGGDE